MQQRLIGLVHIWHFDGNLLRHKVNGYATLLNSNVLNETQKLQGNIALAAN
jgi:hypothetical protein